MNILFFVILIHMQRSIDMIRLALSSILSKILGFD